MLELLRGLCSVYGTSGDESAVAAYIAGILDTVEGVSYEYTPLGGIIAYKKGGRVPKNRVMLDAHMDEVGLIISDIADDGFLKFTTVGGIDPAVLLGRRVKVGSTLCDGVIGLTPIHLLGEDEKKKLPAVTDMYIDIGAQSKQEAEKLVCLGDNAYFYSEYIEFGDCKIKARAIDDRLGCAVMLKILMSCELECDTYFSFSTGEETGGSGAATAAFAVKPDYAIVLEATTAADIINVSGNSRVCVQGQGPAISFMDRSTVYIKELYLKALEIGKNAGIPCQLKTLVAGGNNAGSVHKAGGGVKTLAVSVPCRYLHSAVCVADKRDMDAMLRLTQAVTDYLYDA